MNDMNGEYIHHELNPADGEAIDAFLRKFAEGEQSPEQMIEAAAAGRDRKVAELMSLIGQCPADAPNLDLTKRTIERVQQVRQQQRFNYQIESLRGSSRSGFRMSDLITVAAVILIVVGLISMILPRLQEDARRVACMNQLQTAGMGFGQYADDHQGQMPRYEVKPGSAWYRVGSSDGPVQSNTANLYLLVRKDYLTSKILACPDNPHAAENLTADHHDWPSAASVSYSYANQFTEKPRQLNSLPTMVLLADKNPLFAVGGVRDGTFFVFRSKSSITSAGMFHNQKGQNILQADGSVKWTIEPIVTRADGRKDNFWIIENIRQYRGNEVPSDEQDNFLVP